MRVTLEHEFTNCGKPSCGTCGGAGEGHGPYWYGYASINGRTKKIYFGVKKPSQGAAQEKFNAKFAKGAKPGAKPGAKSGAKPGPKDPPQAERSSHRPQEPRFQWAQKMSMTSALRIMGLETGYTKTALKAAYRELVQKYHPDKARTEAQRIEYTEILKLSLIHI